MKCHCCCCVLGHFTGTQCKLQRLHSLLVGTSRVCACARVCMCMQQHTCSPAKSPTAATHFPPPLLTILFMLDASRAPCPISHNPLPPFQDPVFAHCRPHLFHGPLQPQQPSPVAPSFPAKFSSLFRSLNHALVSTSRTSLSHLSLKSLLLSDQKWRKYLHSVL